MKLHHKIRTRFPTGPSTVLDMPLDKGFMRGALVQDGSSAQNHGTATGSANLPVPQYPGFLFDESDAQSIGRAGNLHGGVYPFTMAAWFRYSGASDERAILSIAKIGTVLHQTLKSYNNLGVNTFGAAGRVLAGMPDSGTCMVSNDSLVADVWFCIVVTCPNTGPDGVIDWAAYKNGVDDSVVQAGRTFDFVATTDNWKIGDSADVAPNALPWNGVLGDIVLERRVWSAAEVKNFFELTRWKYGK